MQIQVNRFATLTKQSVQTVSLAEGEVALDLIQRLGIPVEEVGLLSINGRQATLDQPLHAGDEVIVTPSIGGG